MNPSVIGSVWAHRGSRLATLLAFAILAAAPNLGDAAAIQGRMFSDLYTYEQSESTHVRLYTGMRLNLTAWQDARGRLAEFSGYGRWTTDLKSKPSTGGQTYLYDSYFHLAGFPARSDVYIGRQFVYCGAGSAVVDGLRIKFAIIPWVQIDLFGGSSVSAMHPEKLQSLSEYGSFGGRASAKIGSGTRLGLNWLYRKTDGRLSTNRLALDIEHTIKRWQIFARGAFNVSWLRVAEALARISFQPGKWYGEAELCLREPSVPDASLFSILNVDLYRQIRLQMRRVIWRDMAVSVQTQNTFLGSEHAWTSRINLGNAFYSIGWHHQGGRGGDNDGIHGLATVKLTRRLDAYAAAHAGRYRVQPEQDGRSDAYASQIGLTCRPGWGLTGRIEAQVLRNAVSTSETRLYIHLAKEFSWRDSSREAAP
jgi:hypothetical protein